MFINYGPNEYENEDAYPYDQNLAKVPPICGGICSIPSIFAGLEFQDDIIGTKFWTTSRRDIRAKYLKVSWGGNGEWELGERERQRTNKKSETANSSFKTYAEKNLILRKVIRNDPKVTLNMWEKNLYVKNLKKIYIFLTLV